MKTCTYKHCYDAFIAFTGLEEEPNKDYIKKRFNVWFNSRLRQIWRATRWSFLIKIQPLFVCEFGWIDLPTDLESADLFELFDSDYRSSLIEPQRVDFISDGADSLICRDCKKSTFKNVPSFDAAKTYRQGDIYKKADGIFCKTEDSEVKLTGRIYSQNFLESSAINKPQLDIGDCVLRMEGYGQSCVVKAKEYYLIEISCGHLTANACLRYKQINKDYSLQDEEKSLPYVFKEFIVQGARANWLASENRPEEASVAESTAIEILNEEVYRAELNPYSHLKTQRF